MIIINLKNINGLNDSLQVGDTILATNIGKQSDSIIDEPLNNSNNSVDVGAQKIVGILTRIEFVGDTIDLYVKEASPLYMPIVSDYIMFSKNTQRNGDVSGYYAKAKFVNDSKEKAELFAVSSEVVINSK